MYNVKEENRKNKYQIQTKAREGRKKQKDSDRDLCKNTHTPFHIYFSFYLFITTVEIIKLEQHRGTVEEKISS